MFLVKLKVLPQKHLKIKKKNKKQINKYLKAPESFLRNAPGAEGSLMTTVTTWNPIWYCLGPLRSIINVLLLEEDSRVICDVNQTKINYCKLLKASVLKDLRLYRIWEVEKIGKESLQVIRINKLINSRINIKIYDEIRL